MTALPAHDRGAGTVVRPQAPAPDGRSASWSCGRCDDLFRVFRIRAVVQATEDREVPYAFMVCLGCGDAVTPVRLRLDRLQLRAACDHPDPGLRDVARVVGEHTARVAAMRRDAPGHELSLRGVDTHRLADRLRTDRRHLVRQLQALDALPAVDVSPPPLRISSPVA